MSFHVTGFCPGEVQDIEALEEAWSDFIRALDRLAGQPFEGFIAGGDWVGSDKPQSHAFRLTAAQVRTHDQWGAP